MLRKIKPLLPLIYVAGKYSDKNSDLILKNIEKAEKASVELLKRGWSVFTPHKNTSGYEKYEKKYGFNYDTWMNNSISVLLRCDAIFMLENWKDSSGAVREYNIAKKTGIKIFLETNRYPDPEDLLLF